jgi:hypothetical protein
MLIDLVILNTIIHKRTVHIYLLNHSQKEYFQTNTSRHVYLVQYLHMFLQNHSQKNSSHIFQLSEISCTKWKPPGLHSPTNLPIAAEQKITSPILLVCFYLQNMVKH